MAAALTSDVLIVGGGIVGASLALGMANVGTKVRLLDGGDDDIRASRANFGLVWVQSKGHDMPAYARWTRTSADLWAGFADELTGRTGIALHHRQCGGLSFCLGNEALAMKRASFARLHNQFSHGHADVSVLDRGELERLLPGTRLGDDVAGASFSPQDGDCDPLALLQALNLAMMQCGAFRHSEAKATGISVRGGLFRVETERGMFEAPRLILAAGLGSKALAESLGIPAPIRPERGQILVTERLAPFFPYTGDTIRQTADGTVMVGATHEDVGLDVSTTADGGAVLARHAVSIFPDLASAQLVRQWAGLRVLTPDGCPLYAESMTHPGAALITCHSGITLAAVHAKVLAPALVNGPLGAPFKDFSAARFVAQS